MRCKLACVSILFASGLCGESRPTDGARKRASGCRPGGVVGRDNYDDLDDI